MASKTPISELNKIVFGFIESYINTLDDENVMIPAKQITGAYEAYCNAKGYSLNSHLLYRTIKELDLPYFTYYMDRDGVGAKAYFRYTASNHKIYTIRSLSKEQEQRIYDLSTLYRSMGGLPFLIRPDRAYRVTTLFGYDAVRPVNREEYKGYKVDHLTLSIDDELVLVCLHPTNGKIIRFRVSL